jgi:hypothetical protein
MAAGEEEFVKKRIYLPLERGRDIAVRNLFRKVFITGGFENSNNNATAAAAAAAPVRRTRVPVHEFLAAMRLSTRNEEEDAEMGRGKQMIDRDEVECVLVNLIYKVCPFPSLALFT